MQVPERIVRLGPTDAAPAMRLFAVLAEVFEGEDAPAGEDHVATLLARPDVWVVAVYAGESIVGGVVAHVLPMTRSASHELFIYDVGVLEAHRRLGVGRRMLAWLLAAAAAEGVGVAFVPADNEDTHALEFYRAIGGKAAPVTFFTFGEEDAG